MRILQNLLLLSGLGIGVFFWLMPSQTGSYESLNTKSNSREKQIQDTIHQQVIDFHEFIKTNLIPEAEAESIDQVKLQNDFLKARLLYKKFEWAAEYFIAPLAQRLNGPPDQEVENADLMDPTMTYAINPTGLQVIEELIFSEYNSNDKSELLQELQELHKNARFLASYFNDNTPSDWRILDAAKLQIFRIITLGIVGYDNEIALNSMPESAESLKSLKDILALYTQDNSELPQLIDEATRFLLDNQDFDTFDRAKFITTYANNISSDIAALEKQIPGDKIRYNRMLNQNASTLFDKNAFNVNAFAPGYDYHYTQAKAKLGEQLFYDPNLSGDGSRSCSTCHQPALGFADGLPKNTNIYNPEEDLPRNTPTLLNSALQSNYFHDMRALTLEDQALDVLQNPDEMDGNIEDIETYLNASSDYRKAFQEAFPSTKDTTITIQQLANALASYSRSLTFLNSRFDDYMQGDIKALDEDEIKGFNLYMGKAKCATCHFMPLFNGMTPPKFMEVEAEVIGVPTSLKDSLTDSDKGWYDIVGVDSYEHAFKTPTIRNINLTAPYMHNGVYETLEEVMEFYNNAGSIGLGNDLDNNTLPEDSLQLSDTEISQIIKFMESLESKY